LSGHLQEGANKNTTTITEASQRGHIKWPKHVVGYPAIKLHQNIVDLLVLIAYSPYGCAERETYKGKYEGIVLCHR
jgi:hypothetical protein